MAHTYFSIDLGEAFIKIADVEKKQNKLEVLGIGLIETDKNFYSSSLERLLEEQAQKIAKLVTQLKISKAETNVIIPDSLSYNQVLEMPKLNEKELLSAIKYQADQFIPMPIDQVGIDVEILMEKDKKIAAFLSAASKKIIEKVQKTIEYAGLIVNSIETEASAVGRFTSEIYRLNKIDASSGQQAPSQLANDGVLFVNFGHTTTSLYFYNSALGIVTHTHNFNIGYQLFLKEILVNREENELKAKELLLKFVIGDSQNSELLGVLSPAIKDFTLQIQRFISLLAEKQQVSVRQIIFFGETSRFLGIKNIVEQFIKVPITFFDITPFITNGQSIGPLKHDLSFFPAVLGGNLR